MSKSDNLSVIIGEIENELNSVAAAKEMLEGIAGANSELSASLERLVYSSARLQSDVEEHTKATLEEIDAKVAAINGATLTLEKAATDRYDKSLSQAENAEKRFKERADKASQAAVQEVSASAQRAVAAIEGSQSNLEKATADLRKDYSIAAERQTESAAKLADLLEQAQGSLNEIKDAADELGKFDAAVCAKGIEKQGEAIASLGGELAAAKAAIDGKFDGVEKTLTALKEALDAQAEESAKAKAEIERQSESLDELSQKIGNLENDLSKLEALISPEGELMKLLSTIEQNTQKKGLWR